MAGVGYILNILVDRVKTLETALQMPFNAGEDAIYYINLKRIRHLVVEGHDEFDYIR